MIAELHQLRTMKFAVNRDQVVHPVYYRLSS